MGRTGVKADEVNTRVVYTAQYIPIVADKHGAAGDIAYFFGGRVFFQHNLPILASLGK